ncbi:hypothetical protein ABJB38_00630 [Bifidobacterium bifidum]|uniref:hypothetical protein n=2 Tax=Bifidobacterium bifidum TaxID=1681 RepID=UPI001E59F423|nr:hypothetical protein [Bifidobacterium bifidum]MDB1214731.1 hypothetical protein [Bifidobacterium bifidum]MDB1217736.1 hypothetical protein [Bifidobacterium bifidum]MDB1221101.1 hypothetical protein [Bifidobacterium bifidum]
MSTSSARHEAPRNGRPVKRRLIRVLAGSAVIGAMAVGGLQFALGTAYAAGDVCDLCSTNYNPVACCSSGGSAYDSNPGGGIDVSAQKAAFDSYCANYKKEHAQKEEPATPAPATKPSNPKQSAPAPAKQSSGSTATQTTKPSTGNTTAQQSQPAQSTGTQSGQSTTGSTAGITGDTAANADATATQTSKDAASQKNSDDNTADTAGGETTTTESDITDSGTDTAETTTQASPVTDRAETTSPVVRIVAGVVIALAVIGTLGAALIARNKRRAPALAGANGGRSDDGFDIADGATPAPATTANAIAATEARADASAPDRSAAAHRIAGERAIRRAIGESQRGRQRRRSYRTVRLQPRRRTIVPLSHQRSSTNAIRYGRNTEGNHNNVQHQPQPHERLHRR